jgi:hypothetical protein
MTNFSIGELNILENLFDDKSPQTNVEKKEKYQRTLIRISGEVFVLKENTSPSDNYPTSLAPISKGTQKAYKAFDKIIEVLKADKINGDDALNAFKQALHFLPDDSEYVNNIISQLQELREDIKASRNFNTRGTQGRTINPLTVFHTTLINLYRSENNGEVNYKDNSAYCDRKEEWLTGRIVRFIDAIYIRYEIEKTEKTLTQIKNALSTSPKSQT